MRKKLSIDKVKSKEIVLTGYTAINPDNNNLESLNQLQTTTEFLPTKNNNDLTTNTKLAAETAKPTFDPILEPITIEPPFQKINAKLECK